MASLNPYYNGRYSTRQLGYTRKYNGTHVLILIIMEDTLREQELQVHNIQSLTDYLFHKVNKII